MRRTGILFTLLALVAAQAPWIACDCASGGSIKPLLLSADSHEHDDDVNDGHTTHTNGSSCCHGHGHSHAQVELAGRHCHGTYTHEHGKDDREPTDHLAFRLPMGTMPAPAALAALALDFLTASAPIALASLGAPVSFAAPEKPPGGCAPPSVTTERLLL
ncbi:MAG: hypothetical protein O2894_03485 [Planctomycetota bacterium]|nr:hypothetical protein [Planctomycetota bacterium]